MPLYMPSGGSRLDNGTGSVVVNADGSITITPAAAKNVSLAAGQLLLPQGTLGAPSLAFNVDSGSGMALISGATAPTLIHSGVAVVTFNSGVIDGLRMRSGSAVSWSSGDPTAASSDLFILRESANVLAHRNGANAQVTRLYNTFTDASNYERLDIAWESNALVFRVGAAGTGTQRGNFGFAAQADGQQFSLKTLTELTTIAANPTTDTIIQIPANAVVFAVSVRVTVAIPTAATFTVTGATSGTAFQTGASVGVTANTTDVGTKACPYLNTAAQAIRITPNLTPAAATGRVRVTIHYYEITAPTS